MLRKAMLAAFATFCLASACWAAEPLKIGVAAMISPKETVKFYKKMVDYVGTKLGSPVEVVMKENYDETDKMLEEGGLSIAFVCSGPYVKDKEKFGAELLVAPQSYGKPFYYAYIIVPKDSPAKDIADLKGKKFAFTDPKSNTGRIVPTYMIAKEFNTTPEKFFGRTIFTRSHDKSIEATAKKIVDGASIDSLIYDYLAKKNPDFTAQTKIIRKSQPYGIPPVIVRKDLDPAIKDKIKQIFLTMHKDPAGKAILDGLMVDKFIIPKDADYDSVREMNKWIAKVK